jgi:hypothetical protein
MTGPGDPTSSDGYSGDEAEERAMSTIPPTIPAALVSDVLRKCSPVLVETEDGIKSAIIHVVKTRGEREEGRPGTLYAPIHSYWFLPPACSLDLTDPTGMEHAKRYAAEKLGMDASRGVLFYPVEHEELDHGQYCPAHWVLQVCAGETLYRWVFTEEPTDPLRGGYFFGDAYHGYTTVAGIIGKPDAEALRLVVLAVAGCRYDPYHLSRRHRHGNADGR